MLSELKEGDDVVTIGGIFGRILNIKEDVVTLEVGDKVKLKGNSLCYWERAKKR